jgi:RNA ligase (TIGR02306 family)
MSFKVAYTKILEINPHPNPDVHSLVIATIYGFQVIVRKDTLNVGDLVLFAPVDSILPPDLEALMFPPESKMKLSNSRVRQVRIQKFPSQGLILNEKDVQTFLTSKGYKNFLLEEEKDYASVLGITKYEPEPPKEHTGLPITSKRRLAEHPHFHGYNGLDNIKWGDPFELGELVSIQLKLHGTNARFGNLKKTPKTRWEKFLKFIKLLPEYETRYGSNKVDITAKNGAAGFYETDVYGTAFKKIDAAKKVKPNEVIYGEIIGEGIQKNYHYGHKTPHFVLFDVKVFKNDGSHRWLLPREVRTYAKENGFEMVPELFYGAYNKDLTKTLVSGADPYFPAHKVREGIVIKSDQYYNDPMSSSSKKARKVINPAYLDDTSNTDNH